MISHCYFICISLVINNHKQLAKCLLAFCLCSQRCLFIFSHQFLMRFCCYWALQELYIAWVFVLFLLYGTQIFSPHPVDVFLNLTKRIYIRQLHREIWPALCKLSRAGTKRGISAYLWGHNCPDSNTRQRHYAVF